MENDEKNVLKGVSDGCGKTEKDIRELTEEEAKSHKLLGKAFGINFGHCMYIAQSHCQNFRNRVVGYRLIKNDQTASVMEDATDYQYIAVEFYE